MLALIALGIAVLGVLTFVAWLAVETYQTEQRTIARNLMDERRANPPSRWHDIVRDCAGGGDPFPLDLLYLPLDDLVTRSRIAIDLAAMRAMDAAECDAP